MKTRSVTSIVLISLLFLTACDKKNEEIPDSIVNVTPEMIDEVEARKLESYCNNAEFFGWETEGKCPDAESSPSKN